MPDIKLPDGPKIGVVLSSGGGRGVYAHTGFLLALQELGIGVGAVAGCSAGALVGGVFASGTPLRAWADTIARVRTKEYWAPDSKLRLMWEFAVKHGQGYTGLSNTEAAIDFCRRNLAAQTFEESPIPFYALAMNLTRGEKTLFSSGELAPRLMASAAMPVLYRPVEIEGELYTDGAVIELSPAEALCCKHQLDALIVHHVAIRRDGGGGLAWAASQPWTLVEILALLLYRQRPWYLSDNPIAVHRCPGGCGAPVVVLEPRLPDLQWPLSRGGVDVQLAAAGQTKSLLAPITERLKSEPRTVPVTVAEPSPAGATCHSDKEQPQGEDHG